MCINYYASVAVVLTYNRVESLFQVVKSLGKVPSLAKVQNVGQMMLHFCGLVPTYLGFTIINFTCTSVNVVKLLKKFTVACDKMAEVNLEPTIPT